MKKIILLFFCLSLLSCATRNISQNQAAANINTKLGIGYLQNKQYSRAKEKLLLATTQSPHSLDVLLGWAYFYQVTNNAESADQTYKKVLQKAPHNLAALNNYGAFLCQQGHYPRAIHQFLLAAKSPDNLTPEKSYENAGLCALKIPNKVLANQYFKQSDHSVM